MTVGHAIGAIIGGWLGVLIFDMHVQYGVGSTTAALAMLAAWAFNLLVSR